MTDVIFQDLDVKTDLNTINYQVKVPKRMRNMTYLIIDHMVVTSFSAANFPDKYKEALLQVKWTIQVKKLSEFPILRRWRLATAVQKTGGSTKTSQASWSSLTIILQRSEAIKL